MNKYLFFSIIFLFVMQSASGQRYAVSIEPYPGMIRPDPRLIVKTGYLIVPENRANPSGRKIKLPFFFVRRPDQDSVKNVSLYMTGGPGYSTTTGTDSIPYNTGLLRYGAFISFDQRGTRRAIPSLEGNEIYEAIKQSYRAGNNRDSLVMQAVNTYRERLIKQGIDLSAYNTPETVEDINDLRLALHLDALNLIGISYSGGVMLSMAKQHPESVSRLVLNSPLPGFVNFEESGLNNINGALDQVFENCLADSVINPLYKTLKVSFREYFSQLGQQKFTIRYLDKETKDSLTIKYGKQELLDVIVNRLNSGQVKNLPFVISELINGRHTTFIHEILDEYFAGNPSISLGMRYSVYCSEQIAYADPLIQKQEEALFPWLSGYAFNNVNKSICDCWKVKPVPKSFKQQVYSKIPAIISAGDIDPFCRPEYNRLIKKGLPNARLLIFHDKGHGPGFNMNGQNYLDAFMNNSAIDLTPVKGVIIE